MTYATGETTLYRPDIDGLRAISVLAVVAFHVSAPGFSGGFVGVDVFFVISGFLITQVLLAPRFDGIKERLAGFYLRRCRRILPALLVVIALSTAIAVVLYLPSELRRFGKFSGLSASLLGNVAALTDGSYFELGGRFTPLVNLWSIGVEEQFYLVYPVLLLLVHKYAPQRKLAFVLAAAIVSFLFCVWATHHAPSINFYLTPSRGWELMLGAATALLPPTRFAMSRVVAELVAVLGLAILIATIAMYDRSLSYPGPYTLAPCVATVCLLASGAQSTFVTKMLTWRPLVFTGLISYSLYLLHTPVLAFFSYYKIVGETALDTTMVILVVYLLAALSFSFVERPIRTRRVFGDNRTFIRIAIGTSVSLAVIGWTLWRFDGLPQRLAPELREFIETGAEMHRDAYRCMGLTPKMIASGQLCEFGPDAKENPTAIIFGDSHAIALMSAYEELANSRHFHAYFAALPSCRPLFGVVTDKVNARQQQACVEFNSAIATAIRDLDPAFVVLTSYWDNPRPELRRKEMSGTERAVTFLDALQGTVDGLRASNRTLCAVIDVPFYQEPVPYAYATAVRTDHDLRFMILNREQADSQQRAAHRAIRLLADRGEIVTADPTAILCASGRCEFKRGDKSLYRDNNHLSVTGAKFVTESLAACFDRPPLDRHLIGAGEQSRAR